MRHVSAMVTAWTYTVAENESRELLGICLKSIKGIGKDVQLANASFIWTEPHSKELKVKLELQQEALVGVVVRQTVIVELRVNNLQCDECKKSYTKHTWDSSVQVRQRSEHRRTLMMLEQLILKHKAHTKLIQLTPTKEGLDFFFSKERDAQDFVSFLKNWAVVKHHESKHLVSHNAQNTTYRFKRTTCVEVCPICFLTALSRRPCVLSMCGGCQRRILAEALPVRKHPFQVDRVHRFGH